MEIVPDFETDQETQLLCLEILLKSLGFFV